MSLSGKKTSVKTDLLIEQIEFADVIVLSKTDLTTEEEAAEEAIIKALNPGAKLQSVSKVTCSSLCSRTNLFDYDKAAAPPDGSESFKASIH